MNLKRPELRQLEVSSSAATVLGGQSLFFLLGNIFTLAVGLPLQIYVARVLGASGLGVFSLLEGSVGLVGSLVGFGVAPTVVRFVPAYMETKQFSHVRGLLFWGGSILLIVGVSAAVLATLVLPFLESYWPELSENRVATLMMVTMIPAGLMMFFTQQSLRDFHEIRLALAKTVVKKGIIYLCWLGVAGMLLVIVFARRVLESEA